ncbi:MAG: glycosyltransferase family 39 protein [Aureispira sp.]
MSRERSIELLLLAGCLVLGGLLRLGDPNDWAFINDELSTWAKVSYNSVGEVIANIKAVDSHPVGLYVFVYYWTGIFGTSEWAIKLPFFLMSLGAMGLVYQLGKLWFSKTAGLLALAAFATLQFPIWWSHIARQYQSGSFLTLLMVYCWTQWLVKGRPEKRYWWGFVLAGAAACYNHYFSGLFAALVGLTGLLWVTRKQLGHYLLAGVLMVGLFLPHVSITLYQLQNADGHLWYGVPDSSFFSRHIRYLFHYSWYCLAATVLVALAGMVLSSYKKDRTLEKDFSKGKLRWTALLWFTGLPLFGYWYSVQFSPILRPSHLLFSFPYLLLLLFSFYNKKLKRSYLVGLVGVIVVVNVTSLVNNRRHFEVVHTHPYKHFIRHTKTFLETHERDAVSIILGENPLYLSYYKAYYESPFDHYRSFKPDLTVAELQDIFKKEKRPYLIVGSLTVAQLSCALSVYPYVYQCSYGINYDYYILSKDPKDNQVSTTTLFEETLTWQASPFWEFLPTGVQQDSTGKRYYSLEGEWGPTFKASFDRLTTTKHCLVDVALSLRGVDSSAWKPNGTLVVEFLDENDSTLAWYGVEAAQQLLPSEGEQQLYLSYRLAHQTIYTYKKAMQLKIYFWNREKQPVYLDRFRVTIREDNPILYKDTQPF